MKPLEVRNLELEETPGIVLPLANHIILNLLQVCGEDDVDTPEWREKLDRWTKAWLHAHEVLTPGITKPRT